MLINEIVIAIFFLYFVLLSGVTNRVLNCDLQRLVRDHVYLNHILLFLSIFMFTYILKWYGFAGLEGFNNNEYIKNLPQKIQYLIKTLTYTFFIYFVFLLSTKNGGNFMIFFLISFFVIICLQLFSKALNPDLYNKLKDINFISLTEAKKKFLNDEEQKYSYFDQHIMIHNFLYFLYLVLFVSLLLGSYKYYIKQKKSFGKKFDWLSFWFGTNKCKGKFI